MQANGVRPFKGKSTPFRYSLIKGLLKGIQLLSLHLGGGGFRQNANICEQKGRRVASMRTFTHKFS